MKSRKRWIHSNVLNVGSKKTSRIEWIPFPVATFTKETMPTQLTYTSSSSINVDDIEAEGTDIGNSVVRACGTDVSLP